MENIKISKIGYKALIESYDWNLATDLHNKRILPPNEDFDRSSFYVHLAQFPHIEINEDDVVYGVFNSGQKVFIAKAPYCFNSALELEQKIDC